MNIQAFLDTIPIMLKGMAGIFVVTVMIIIAMYVLGKIGKDKGEKEYDKSFGMERISTRKDARGSKKDLP